MKKFAFLLTAMAIVACDGATSVTKVEEPNLDVSVQDHTWWYDRFPADPALVGYVSFHARRTPDDTIWWEFAGYHNGELDVSKTGIVLPGVLVPQACEDPLPSCRVSFSPTDSTRIADTDDDFYLRFTATSPGTDTITVEWIHCGLVCPTLPRH